MSFDVQVVGGKDYGFVEYYYYQYEVGYYYDYEVCYLVDIEVLIDGSDLLDIVKYYVKVIFMEIV